MQEQTAATNNVPLSARAANWEPRQAAPTSPLALIGDSQAAAEAYERAIGLESDSAVRRFLQNRRARAMA